MLQLIFGVIRFLIEDNKVPFFNQHEIIDTVRNSDEKWTRNLVINNLKLSTDGDRHVTDVGINVNEKYWTNDGLLRDSIKNAFYGGLSVKFFYQDGSNEILQVILNKRKDM